MMKRVFQFRLTTLLVFILSISGCTATSQPSKFYLLNSLSSSEQAVLKDSLGLAIGIGPIVLPEYVDRPQIVTRVSANELSLAEFHKWAEPLKDNIPQVLVDNLSVLMKTDQVASYPWKRTTPIDYQISIDITRFDTASDGEAHLIARWHVYGKDTRFLLDTKKSHFTAPVQGPDYVSIVSALNQTIGDLSRSLAKSIVRVHSKTKKEK